MSSFNEGETSFLERFCSKKILAQNNDDVVTLLRKKYTSHSDEAELIREKDNLPDSRFCDGYKQNPTLIENVPNCLPPHDRTIFVVDIIEHGRSPLISYGNVSCNQDPLPYKIVYLPVLSHDINASIVDTHLPQFSNTCNAMVMYMKKVSTDATGMIRLANLLTKVTKLPINKTLYLFSIDTPGDLFILKSPDIRIINVKTVDMIASDLRLFYMIGMSVDELVIKERRITRDGFEFEIIKTARDKPYIFLQCTWWFKRFLMSIFDCGKSRLMQFGPTCYVTSVINAMILNNGLRMLVTEAINKKVRENPELVPDIKNPNSINVSCKYALPFITPNDSTFLYIASLFYQVVCRGKSGKSISQEIASRESHNIFEKPHEKLKITTGTGFVGGFPMLSIYAFFTALNINHLYVIDNVFLQPQVLTVAQADYIKATMDFKSVLSQVSLSATTDCVILAKPGINNTPVSRLPQDAMLISNGFYPVASIISITGTSKTNPSSRIGHALVGFICNGVYKVYDSDDNSVQDFDWNNFSSAGLLKLFGSEQYSNFNIKLNIENVFYMNSAVIERLIKFGNTCNI